PMLPPRQAPVEPSPLTAVTPPGDDPAAAPVIPGEANPGDPAAREALPARAGIRAENASPGAPPGARAPSAADGNPRRSAWPARGGRMAAGSRAIDRPPGAKPSRDAEKPPGGRRP